MREKEKRNRLQDLNGVKNFNLEEIIQLVGDLKVGDPSKLCFGLSY